MSLKATRYTKTQREAMIAAVLDNGCSQLEAIRRGEAGELDGCKPFGPVARGTLQGWLRQAMRDRKRTVDTTPDELREKLLAEVWEEVELTIPTLKGEEKLRRIRQAATAIDSLEKKPAKTGRPAKAEGEEEKQPEVAQPAEVLEAPSIERLRKMANATAHDDPSPQDSPTGTAQPAVAHAQGSAEEQTDDGSGGGRVIANAHDRGLGVELGQDQVPAPISR